MGVTISTHATLSPISLASTIIGFVSFAFTLGTFFKVVWINLTTLGEAEHEVHSFLTVLRTEILEERANLRVMRKGSRKFRKQLRPYEFSVGTEIDEAGLKTMSDALRHYIRRFRELEKPFLDEGEPGIANHGSRRTRPRRRNSSLSPPRYSHAAYSSPPEKAVRSRDRERVRSRGGAHERDGDWDMDESDDPFWAQRVNYAPYTLRRRFQWLTRKSDAQSLQQQLTRLQVRRIARQMSGVVMMMHEYGCRSLASDEAVQRIEDKVSRIVGGRRRPDQ